MIAYLDCSTGVSGDKFLGALVDAGFDPTRLREALDGLGRQEGAADLQDIRLETGPAQSGGVSGVGVTVSEPGAPRRHWREIRALLEGALLEATGPDPVLPAPVIEGALRAFSALAEAEARVHGIPADDVHFHEIGAADTLADILGVSLALHDLGIERLVASPVAVGSGTVATEHGALSVPAPATARLLEGVPVAGGAAGGISAAEPGELTTPTGAALLRAFASGFGDVPAMTVRRIGIGCGTRDIGAPNVCVLLVGESNEPEAGQDDVVLLETNLDHLTPEEIATAATRLLDAGALDVWQTPVVMKKGRAATVLSVLASPTAAASLAARMIAETGTLGVRMFPASRRRVERDVSEIGTSFGPARFKVAHLPDGTRTLRVESDDAARIAAEHQMAVHAVSRLLEDEAARITGIQPMRQRSSSQTTNPSD